jgi:hypothetical protein
LMEKYSSRRDQDKERAVKTSKDVLGKMISTAKKRCLAFSQFEGGIILFEFRICSIGKNATSPMPFMVLFNVA